MSFRIKAAQFFDGVRRQVSHVLQLNRTVNKNLADWCSHHVHVSSEPSISAFASNLTVKAGCFLLLTVLHSSSRVVEVYKSQDSRMQSGAHLHAISSNDYARGKRTVHLNPVQSTCTGTCTFDLTTKSGVTSDVCFAKRRSGPGTYVRRS